MTEFDATLGLGSNVGDKAANIKRAIELLTSSGDLSLVRFSRLYRTAPWGKTDQDWFVNACIAVSTDLDARGLLDRCQTVERDLGRVRIERWGPRLIDIDILTFRDETVREPDLIIPHPLIASRAFVLVPLAEIAPGILIDGRSAAELLRSINASDVVPYAP